MKSLILKTTAVFAALLMMGSTMYAQTNDWTKGSIPPGAENGATCTISQRSADSSSLYNHAEASFSICWQGTDVWVLPSADDRQPGDGRGAAAQILYNVKINGTWRQHKRIAAFDHTPDGRRVLPGWSKSRYPTTRLLVRACLSKPGERNTVDETTCDKFR